jgi:hypothetical protein
MKKLTSCLIILMFITLTIGCTEQQSKDNNYLDDIALTLNDLEGSYEVIDENYITEPYLSDDSKLFSGWNVIQKYRIVFLKNDTDFIQHEIVKLSSENKTIEFQNDLKNKIDDVGYDFSSITVQPIGNITLLFQAETQIDNTTVTIYLLTFNYKDLVVIIQTANIDQETITAYANIVYNNILEVTEYGL